MSTQEFKHIFGPVPSRRLGRSLGIDLVPFKTCPYDCIYCQLGRTTEKALVRKEYVPISQVIEEIKESLKAGSAPDYITLSGSGEPTLCLRIGELISKIKKLTDIPVAVITNGSLLWDKDVQEELGEADLVIPSLDAGDEKLFQYVNRPHPEISFQQMVDGLIDFRKHYKNSLWLEIFLLGGVTAINNEVEKIAGYVKQNHPEKVQLNTVVRPAAESFAFSVPEELMQKFASILGPNAEVIADYSKVHKTPEVITTSNEVLNLLRRRSCTVADLAGGLGLHRNEVLKHITRLLKDNLIFSQEKASKVYYLIK